MPDNNQAAESRPNYFVDPERKLIDLATAATLIAQRPNAQTWIFGRVADKGERLGKTTIGALALMIEQHQIACYFKDDGSGTWRRCSSDQVMIVQRNGSVFGIALSDGRSPFPGEVAVSAGELIGYLDGAEEDKRRREAQQEEERLRQEAARQQIAQAYAAAEADQAAKNTKLHETIRARDLAQNEARERQQQAIEQELAAALRGSNSAER